MTHILSVAKVKAEPFLKVPFVIEALVFLIGFALGYVAWGEGRAAMVAALLPAAVSISTRRRYAAVLGGGYAIAAGRGVPWFAGVWFDHPEFVSIAVTVLGISFGAIAWGCVGWSSSTKVHRKCLAVLAAWFVGMLPPFGLGLMGHPLFAWGYITPGWKWIGVALSIAAPCVLIGIFEVKKVTFANRVLTLLSLSLVLISASLGYEGPNAKYANEFVGVGTHWGVIQSEYETTERIERMGRASKALAKDHLATVVLFPESILGPYDPANDAVLKAELLEPARAAGQNLIVGVDMPTEAGNSQSTALIFRADGTFEHTAARLVVPFALWRPWSKSGHFEWSLTEKSVFEFGGIKARLIFCYEENLPLLALFDEATQSPNIYLVMTNTWSDPSGVHSSIQDRSSESMALLFGRKRVKAENRFGHLQLTAPIPVTIKEKEKL